MIYHKNNRINSKQILVNPQPNVSDFLCKGTTGGKEKSAGG
jgi:hypothetical protein